jgi:uncharacterized protein (TIGR00730 family)
VSRNDQHEKAMTDKEARAPGPFQLAHEDAAKSAVEETAQPVSIEQLVQQMKDTADKFIRDKASRGDVKMITTALKELRYALKVFAPYRSKRKVTVFGSARTGREHPSYRQAVEFGRRMAAEGYMVVTGAASGIMEAGHVGAGLENALGVNILLPFEQAANSIIAGDGKLVHLKYFFTRKLMFVKEADAVALFPGGFGTQDEGFEVLTLVQTGKSHMFPVVLIDEPGGDYWKRWAEFIRGVLLERGLISPADISLFKITDSVDEAIAEIKNFYRVYHSMRYVGDQLVLRLQKPLGDSLLDRLRADFADILAAGTFEQVTALPAEQNETTLAHLPRLRFQFDRKSLGRLREMIDEINREC